jgi:hypothetical protein
VVKLDVDRSDGEHESYYLDPQTWLEVARRSPGSDFGEPTPMWTTYFDFRPVGGLVVPHRLEMEYGIRHLVQEVEAVELDRAVEAERFAMPLSEGMAPLRALAGEWEVAIETRGSPRAPFAKTAASSTITALHGGNVLEERLSWVNQGIPFSVVRLRSWDRFRKLHKVAEIDDFTSHLNLLEGTLAGGRLVVSNERTGTPAELFGQTYHDRVTLSAITPDGFQVEAELSTDGGKTWWLATKAVYARKPPAS